MSIPSRLAVSADYDPHGTVLKQRVIRQSQETTKKKGERSKTSASKFLVSAPTNTIHMLRVDANYNWSNKDNTTSSAFSLGKQLGRGATGSVFKAHHRQLNIHMAVKIVEHPSVSAQEQISREIEVLRKCRHENIVTYYGCLVQENACWILMDLMELGSIKDLIVLGVKLSEHQIAALMFEALKGLIYLHSTGLVHRDVKSANILMNTLAEVKIADFGLCSNTISSDSQQLTAKQQGTLLFMAPECLQGRVCTASDIWSLGITAIEMAEQEPPFSHENPGRVMFILLNEGPPSLQGGGWTSDFKRFVTDCLDKNCDTRPTAEAMIMNPFLCRPTEFHRRTLLEILSVWKVKNNQVAEEPAEPSKILKSLGDMIIGDKGKKDGKLLDGGKDKKDKAHMSQTLDPRESTDPIINSYRRYNNMMKQKIHDLRKSLSEVHKANEILQEYVADGARYKEQAEACTRANEELEGRAAKLERENAVRTRELQRLWGLLGMQADVEEARITAAVARTSPKRQTLSPLPSSLSSTPSVSLSPPLPSSLPSSLPLPLSLPPPLPSPLRGGAGGTLALPRDADKTSSAEAAGGGSTTAIPWTRLYEADTLYEVIHSGEVALSPLASSCQAEKKSLSDSDKHKQAGDMEVDAGPSAPLDIGAVTCTKGGDRYSIHIRERGPLLGKQRTRWARESPI